MKMKIKLVLIGMILIGCSLVGAANAEEKIEVELFTYIVPQDIRENDFDVSVQIEAQNIPSSEYPLKIEYLLDNREILNRTIERGGSFSLNTWFSAKGKPDGLYLRTEVLIFSSNGSLIGSANKFEPIYMIDIQKETAELQLISLSIEKVDKGILEWFKEDSYEITYSVKNMNKTFAFKGTMDFGDLGVLSDWKFSEKTILGPRQTIKIEGPIITEKDLKDLKTELRYCVFC